MIAIAGLAVAAGVLVLTRALRALGMARDSTGTALLVAFGTALPAHVVEARIGPCLLFLVDAILLAAWAERRAAGRPARPVAWGLLSGLVLAALDQAADLASQALRGQVPRLALLDGGPFALEALFSSRQGFFFWTPLAAVALFGFIPLARRDVSAAGFCLAATTMLGVASALSAPWWSGGFGNGRLTPALPVLAPGLAAVMRAVRNGAARRPLIPLGALALALVLWNLAFMEQYRDEMVPRDDTVAFPEVAANNARLVARRLGTPLAWPAAWAFAARTGLPAERYDLAVGLYLFALPNDLRGTLDVGDLETDAALLAEGWSVRHPCQDQVCREVEGRARALVPLDRREALDLRVRAGGAGTLTVAINGAPVATAWLVPKLGDVKARIPAVALRRGFNEITLAVSPGGQALVDRLVFTRLGRGAVNLEEYERMYAAEESQWWYAGMRAISFALLDSLSSDGTKPLLLDAGCGTGNNLVHLAARARPIGVDLSEEALRFCRTRGVAVARAGLLRLPFADGSFDGVTSFDVLYHRWVEDDGRAVRELARVLRPGGWMLVRVPALRMLWGAHDEAVHSRHRYTAGEVRRLLEGAGLQVQRLTYANTLLFPVILARRTLDRLSGRHGSDVSFLPAPLEWAFRRLLGVEARLVKRLALPVGASVFALALKGPALAGAPR